MGFLDDPNEELEGQLVDTSFGGALGELNRSEIDVQISTAKKFPRNLRRFRDECHAMACLDEATAAECFYSIPRGGKQIVGPSARFAEIAASAWGNNRSGARVIGEDGRFVTAQGAFYDLERNMAVTYEVRRRITDSKGRRYNDDMITVTANAACAIALRNAVLKGIPRAYWTQILDAAKKTAIGDAQSLTEKRHAMVAYFAKMGVAADRVVKAVGKPVIEEVTLDDLLILKGLATALREGDTTIEEAFPQDEKPEPKEEQAPEQKRRGRPPKAKAESSPERTAEESQEAPAPSADEQDAADNQTRLLEEYCGLLAMADNHDAIQRVVAEATADKSIEQETLNRIADAGRARWHDLSVKKA